MDDNLGLYLWLLVMLFITGLLSVIGYVVWQSERRGYYQQTPRSTPKRAAAEEKPPKEEEDRMISGE